MSDHNWQQVPLDPIKHLRWVIRGNRIIFECTRCGLSAPASAFTHDQDQNKFFEDCDSIIINTVHDS